MPQINAADTAFMLVSSALVLLMTPGLALFYAGMGRRKNVLSITMQSLFAMGLLGVLWALVGFTLAFGPDVGGIIGGLKYLGLNGVNAETFGPKEHTIPLAVFAMYQGMFAIITPALISGAIAERMKFSAYCLFIALWSLLIYAPLAHWMWGGGWMQQMGILDFAGGAVVHISAGAASLAAAIAVGPRRGFPKGEFVPHNLPMTILGVGILWFGWFGFNAGSALGSTELAASTFLATHVAAAGGMTSWVLAEWVLRGKPTTLGAASGAVAGLGTITAASGFVDAGPALLIGLVAGVVCYFAVQAKFKLRYDDSLDVVGVHGVGGTMGMLFTGLFAGVVTNAGYKGLIAGNPQQLWLQLIGIVATMAFTFIGSFVILKVLDVVVGLRVSAETEDEGLDIRDHAEEGYVL